MRSFNTAGPCLPDRHYMVPPEPRLPDAGQLIQVGHYFVVHAPRQTGKTTTLKALAASLTAEVRYAALLFSCDVGRAGADDYPAAIRGILSEIRWASQYALPPDLRPPDRPGPLGEDLRQLDDHLTQPAVDHGTLVVFDRRDETVPLADRTGFAEDRTPTGRPVAVLRA